MEIDADFGYLDTVILENLTREGEKYIDLSKKIAKDVHLKNLTILETIQKLGCLLLNQSFAKRDVGVLILSETLQNLENGNLNPDQLTVLASYFLEKLKDHHQVAAAALKGVLVLVSFSDIPDESVVQLVSCIFNHVTCQQQQQQDRYLIYQIYETVLKQHVSEVNLMGIDFVYGVISSIDGERDPKNLVYLFNWLQVFLKTVKLGHLTEEMFEVLACYFPVDFKAPAVIKSNITREELAQGLCKCLTCIADFGQYAIPLVLEKLESTLKIAKEDSLDILRIGCKNYETQIYYQYSIEIWSRIQKEIFGTADIDLRQKCLETLKEIISKLSHGDQKNFENTVLDIVDTLKGNILPDSKLFIQSSQMLVYIAKANQISSVLVIKKIAPFLENTFKITNNQKHKALILHNFIDFVKALIETNNKTGLSDIEEIVTCSSLCGLAIMHNEPDLIIEGYRGFTEIIPFISENARHLYLQNLREALLASLPVNIKQAVLKSLEKMAEVFPEDVEKHTLHKQTLCDVMSINNYLEGLNSIVQLPHFEDYVIETYIGYSIASVDSSTVALKHLNSILSKFDHISKILVAKNFMTQFLDFLIRLHDTESTNDFLEGAYSVLQSIIRSQEANFQRDVYSIYSNGNFRSKNVYVVVMSGLIVPFKRGEFEDYNKIDLVLDCSLNDTEGFVKNISLEVLANVLNKIENEPFLEDKLNKIKISCDNCNSDTKVWLISWVTKSLVTRNHPKAWQWTDMLLNCLQDNTKAAVGFKIVMDDSYQTISKENYCQIMPLYKQKFFVYCTNKLGENCQNDTVARLNVVGYLVETAPKQAVLGHFKKILRLILLCLENSNETEVLEKLLQRITEFVVSGEPVIEENLEDILLRVLNLTAFEGSMTVRLAALWCLRQITETYKVYQLFPYKQKVIQQLGMCVDDKKRLVRKGAMECRSLWYLLDAPL